MQPTFSQPTLKVLTFGAGAIGTYVGGSLALAGHHVTFVEQPAVMEELRTRGMRLDLTLDKRRNTKDVFVLEPSSFVIVPSLEEALRYGPFDVGIFALKSFDTESALEGMQPFADKMPPILCLSNGVDNEPMIARVLGPDKVIPGTISTVVGRRKAGDIVLDKLRGVGVAAGHALSERLAAALDGAYLNCRIYPDAQGMKWSKMLSNLVANPTSAILDMTAAQIFANKDLHKIEIAMLSECLAVMKAQGIEVVNLPGIPVKFFVLAIGLPLWLSRLFLRRIAGSGRGAKMPSFHIDLHSGRGKSEVGYLHGAVVRAGEKANVATPVNKLLTDTLMSLIRNEIPLEEYAHQPEKLLARLPSNG